MVDLRDYKKDSEALRDFFVTFHGRQGKQKKQYVYAEQLERIANREQVALQIALDDVAETNEELADAIQGNTVRYQRIAEQVVQDLLANYRSKPDTEVARDSLDVYIQHRIAAQVQINALKPANAPQPGAPGAGAANPAAARDAESAFPGELLRRFEVYFRPRTTQKTLSIRQVRADVIGRLIALQGVVTRTTGVKPLIRVATYTCDQCGSETYQIVSSAAFTPLVACTSEACKTNRAGGRLYLQARGSKFVRFQELKVQELAEDVPVGHVPRSVTLVCTGENTRLCAPGDVVSVTGVYLPLVRGGNRQFAGGLLSETFIDVHEIARVQKGGWGAEESERETLTAEELELLRAETADKSNLYENLAVSIAPEIYGHLDVKKALLLLLVGGVDRAPKGMHIRGNIHICLMGDPGVAKSQLLTYIERLAPRCQYTTGRGSSGVGLTAAVTKDPFTGEMVLEGGALVLADRGICCIDEFDKMQDQDRVAIHEVMEQQTISIAKAGILTTLSARVSILAAANPAYGRYNPRRSLEQNIDLPAALLSRFDLLWLIQDRAERENDLRLANHVTYIHTHNRQPPTHVRPYDASFIRKYIAACQRLQPSLPEDLTEHIVAAYVNMRNEARNVENRHISTFVSPRTLLAILRLSTALARLRLSSTVDRSDVDEAIRLIEVSKSSLVSEDREAQQRAPIDAIYALIRELTKARQSSAVMMQQVYERSFAKGFTPDQVNECIDQYEQMNIWQLNPDRTKLIIVQ